MEEEIIENIMDDFENQFEKCGTDECSSETEDEFDILDDEESLKEQKTNSEEISDTNETEDLFC
jgi:hypothetical protein